MGFSVSVLPGSGAPIGHANIFFSVTITESATVRWERLGLASGHALGRSLDDLAVRQYPELMPFPTQARQSSELPWRMG